MSGNTCELCGGPMPEGEEMFKYHGLSGPCPQPWIAAPVAPLQDAAEREREPNDGVCSTYVPPREGHGRWGCETCGWAKDLHEAIHTADDLDEQIERCCDTDDPDACCRRCGIEMNAAYHLRSRPQVGADEIERAVREALCNAFGSGYADEDVVSEVTTKAVASLLEGKQV